MEYQGTFRTDWGCQGNKERTDSWIHTEKTGIRWSVCALNELHQLQNLEPQCVS